MTPGEAVHPPFAVAVDLVVLTIRGGRLQVLLVERGTEPYRGRLALPGGFVHRDEDLLPAAIRELSEETGISQPFGHIEQLASYGRPDRDPRMRVVSVAYLAVASDIPDPVAGTDAAASRFMVAQPLLERRSRLAFDHGEILREAVERVRAKLEYSALGTAFCAREFTVGELRAVYEAVWGTELDPRNFHRKVTGTSGFLTPTGTMSARGGGRPARLYRSGSTKVLNPPILRG